jgi:DNA-binding MarR family transcriptional regulator
MSEQRKRILSRNEVLTSYRLVLLANYFVWPIYAEVERRYGIARGEFVVVFCLKQLGTLRAKEICEITRHPKNSVSQALKKLVEEDYVRRSPDQSDGRQALLSLTSKGQSLYDKIIPLFSERQATMLSVLKKGERTELERLLGKLVLRNDDWI